MSIHEMKSEKKKKKKKKRFMVSYMLPISCSCAEELFYCLTLNQYAIDIHYTVQMNNSLFCHNALGLT